ncbi:MAG: hypothetical protein RMJ33_03345 [Saprospiraceae bacterium]|nr:hypothetical protein [Saprospiraceae bacterium]MDW8228853.1 hypothetical protein [Saprospiraceae bacterium]
MSKKRFSEGLDELLQSSGDTTTAALPQAENAVRERRASTSKNFVRDLEALFEEALADNLDDIPEGEANTPTSTAQMPAHVRNAGLDALIRPTSAYAAETADVGASLKRLTVTVERAKLEKLRLLARTENLYLKDLLQRAIDEFLKKYEPDASNAL